jgi:predicted CxxxxCH...CXXCH cytochrome family protein
VQLWSTGWAQIGASCRALDCHSKGRKGEVGKLLASE